MTRMTRKIEILYIHYEGFKISMRRQLDSCLCSSRIGCADDTKPGKNCAFAFVAFLFVGFPCHFEPYFVFLHSSTPTCLTLFGSLPRHDQFHTSMISFVALFILLFASLLAGLETRERSNGSTFFQGMRSTRSHSFFGLSCLSDNAVHA